jgi:hypothetical protein
VRRSTEFYLAGSAKASQKGWPRGGLRGGLEGQSSLQGIFEELQIGKSLREID